MKGNVNESRARIFNSNIFRSSLIALFVISILILAYITGGTPNTYLHLIYIPIILSAYYWRVIGGISVAIISGILAGILPLSNSEGVVQDYNNWIIRLLILTFVGFITGFIFKKIGELNKKERERDFINPLTGIYNTNKLINSLEKRINDVEEFVIISIKLTNIETVGKYIKPEFAKGILKGLINELLIEYGKDAVFSSSYDEIDLVICPSSQYFEKCQHIIRQYSTAFGAKQSKFRVTMKIGIYEYHGTKETAIDVYNKARIAHEQGSEQESGIYNYNKEFEINRKEILEISGSLLESINNKELYLVYQPKINIVDNRILGVEVLTRWNRKDKNPVEPDVFIRLAEDKLRVPVT